MQAEKKPMEKKSNWRFANKKKNSPTMATVIKTICMISDTYLPRTSLLLELKVEYQSIQ